MYVVYSQLDRGIGNFAQVIDIPMGGTVRYEVSGRVRENAESIRIRVEATPGPEQRDAFPNDNVSDIEIGVVDALVADLNDDGIVDFADFLVIVENFSEMASREDGDIDGSGTVDFLDFLFLARNFGRSQA